MSPPAPVYFLPVIVRSSHAALFDALLALDIPHDETMLQMVAHWHRASTTLEEDAAILTSIQGGRAVAAVPECHASPAPPRWLACNAYPLAASSDQLIAGRQLQRLLRRQQRGLLVRVDADALSQASHRQTTVP